MPRCRQAPTAAADLLAPESRDEDPAPADSPSAVPTRIAAWLADLRRGEWPRLEDAVALLAAASLISKPITNVAGALCVVVFARDWRAGRQRPRATPLDAAILAWVLTSVLSGITSIDPQQSFRDLRTIGHWGVYYLVAWTVASGASLRRLENVWLAAGVATAAQALLQAAFGFDLLGRSTAVPTGFFGGHLELGHYMVILLGLAAARSSEARDWRERALVLLALIACAAGLVLSGGRGPWLAFLAVVGCWAVVQGGRRAVAVLALVVCMQALHFSREPRGLEAFYRSYVTFEFEDPSPVAGTQVASNVWRLAMWREGLRLFALRPLTGTGVETTRELSQDFRTPFPDLAVAHLHSNYFEILMTRGFFGLAAFFFLLITCGRVVATDLSRSPSGAGRAARFAALAAVVTHAVHGLTHFTVGSSWIQIGFYVALGLGVGAVVRQAEERGEAARAAVDTATVASAIVAIALIMLVAPWLAAHSTTVLVLTMLALLDAGAVSATGRLSALCASLVAAFSFVVVASFGLLLLSPLSRDLGLRVLLAGAVPFVLGHASARLMRALQPSQRNS